VRRRADEHDVDVGRHHLLDGATARLLAQQGGATREDPLDDGVAVEQHPVAGHREVGGGAQPAADAHDELTNAVVDPPGVASLQGDAGGDEGQVRVDDATVVVPGGIPPEGGKGERHEGLQHRTGPDGGCWPGPRCCVR